MNLFPILAQAWYMLYAWLPKTVMGRRGCRHHHPEGRILAGANFSNVRTAIGDENGNPSSVVLVSAALRDSYCHALFSGGADDDASFGCSIFYLGRFDGENLYGLQIPCEQPAFSG